MILCMEKGDLQLRLAKRLSSGFIVKLLNLLRNSTFPFFLLNTYVNK